MSTTLEFVVLSHSSQLTSADASIMIRLRHHGDSPDFIAQFLDLGPYGLGGYDGPVVETHEVPRGFSFDVEEGRLVNTDPISPPLGGHRLRYMYAGEIHKTELPEWANDQDRAMMAYLKELDGDRVVVLYIS